MNDFAIEEPDDDVSAARKREKRAVPLDVFVQTTQTFSGIVGRPLILRRAANTFKTDGTTIYVDPDHAVGYHVLEHEIAHILFKSDAAARAAFVEAYRASVASAFTHKGLDFDSRTFTVFLSHVIGHLEDRRVNSLWSDLYPGSARLLREWMRTDMMKSRGASSLRQLLAEREVDLVRGKASDSERALGEMFSAAYRMVDRRGFASTLIASRWLMTQLVSFFVQQPQQQQQQPQQEQGQGGGGGEGDEDGDEGSEGAEGSEGDDSPEGSGEKTPEQAPRSAPASAEARLQAMTDLLKEAAKTQDKDGSKAEDRGVTANDFTDAGLTSKAAELQAERLARDILRQAVDESEAACEGTAEAMQDIVNDVRDRLGLNAPIDPDDWLRRDLKAIVDFVDIKKHETAEIRLTPEQRLTVQRLRAHFMRVLGRQAITLEDTGSEIDVRAYIDRKVTNEPVPFFKAETSGRGFEALIVLDRSGSMCGANHMQVNRACQMLAEALDFPFVKLRVWGFNSPSNGVARISRFAPGTRGFESSKSASNGLTPLHVATQLGIREMMRGKGVRHLFMLTDGQPEFASLYGGGYSHEAMRDMTRKAILQGKRVGVNTTGILLGRAVGDAEMSQMFVSERNWQALDNSSTFCADLFNLVIRNFGAYLRGR